MMTRQEIEKLYDVITVEAAAAINVAPFAPESAGLLLDPARAGPQGSRVRATGTCHPKRKIARSGTNECRVVGRCYLNIVSDAAFVP
jgi:hypothetical protein